MKKLKRVGGVKRLKLSKPNIEPEKEIVTADDDGYINKIIAALNLAGVHDLPVPVIVQTHTQLILAHKTYQVCRAARNYTSAAQWAKKTQSDYVLVDAYRLCSYLYYEHDYSLVSDGSFDNLCKRLLNRFDEIEMIDAEIERDMLEAGTGIGLTAKDRTVVAAVYVSEVEDNDELRRSVRKAASLLGEGANSGTERVEQGSGPRRSLGKNKIGKDNRVSASGQEKLPFETRSRLILRKRP